MHRHKVYFQNQVFIGRNLVLDNYFRNLYEQLYTSNCTALDDIEKFLDSVDLPKISESAKSSLNVTIGEIRGAIK